MKAPRFARFLLRLTAPAHQRDDVLGDLEESHRRRVLGPVAAWLATVIEATIIALALVWCRLRAIGAGLLDWLRAPATADFRLAGRLMVRQPVLAITATLSLAIGIGVAGAGFAVMDALLFSQLPFEGGDRFVKIRPRLEPGPQPATLLPSDYLELRRRATMMEHLGGVVGTRENVVLPSGEIDVVEAAGITPSTLRFLPGGPTLGRLLSPADAAPGAQPVVMLRESFWRRQLGAAPDILGASIDVGRTTRQVVGVVPDDYQFPNAPALWFPLSEQFLDGLAPPDSDIQLLGVLASGRSLDAAADQLRAIGPGLSGAAAADGTLQLDVVGFTDLGPLASSLSSVIVSVVVGILIVIAANVANLILARSFSRARELSVRAALGASRQRLVGQIFCEVLAMGAVAAVLGTLAGQATLRRFDALNEIPYWIDFSSGPRTLVLVAVATLVATAVAGAWPALRATRGNLVDGLQSGGERSSEVHFGRMAGTMVVVQIALSVAMLNGSLIVAEGYSRYSNPSLDLPVRVLTTGLGVNAIRASGQNDAGRAAVTVDDVARVVSEIPEIIAAGFATALPGHSPSARVVEVEPSAGEPRGAAQLATSAAVSAGFLDALDARPVAGRLLAREDYLPGAPRVVVVNEPFVQRFLGAASPIGVRMRLVNGEGRGPWRTIVGVVPDLGLSVGDTAFAAGFYEPLDRDSNYVYLAARTAGDPIVAAGPLRRALTSLDPELFVSRIQLLEDEAEEDRDFFGAVAAILLGLGGMTLVLALAGVYAMMSVIVLRRTREIGIRVALGSTRRGVVRVVVGQVAAQVAVGGALGCVLAWLSLGLRSGLASRLGDGGAWTLPLVVGLLAAAGVAATWVPVRQALSVPPVDALRAE